jgi:hypothetical protein
LYSSGQSIGLEEYRNLQTQQSFPHLPSVECSGFGDRLCVIRFTSSGQCTIDTIDPFATGLTNGSV